MGSYVPTTPSEREEMLKRVGVGTLKDLYKNVPSDMFVKELNIPGGMSELEVRATVTAMAEKNKVYKTILRGAGAYNHFIPAVVKSVTSREEIVTCYTPYQAEISQGVLQSIFEFQTMMCDIESVKAVADVICPVSGVVAEVNEALLDAPESLNADPYGAWIAKIENITDFADLMSADEYKEYRGI